MASISIEQIATLIVAIAALAGWFVTWKKSNAEIEIGTVAAASELIDDYRLDNTDLRQRLTALEQKLEMQHQKILKLELELFQAWERITALETENEILENENDDQKTFITELRRLQDGTKDIK